MKVHLVDGTYELFRAYYGAPSASDASGAEIGATRGLLRSLASLLAEPGVSHLAVAFDHVIESFRNDLYDGYKRGDGIEPELFAQFELAEHAATALGVVVWPMVEFEADDALATGAARYATAPGVESVVLCSPDKDLAQCVEGDRVVCFDRMRGRVLNAEGVEEKFGVSAASIPDYLALVGDSADGIPGIPGWGAKSAATVLAHYEHIEHVPEDPAAWQVKVRGAKRLAENLNGQRADAELYRTLATLRRDVPLTETVADLEWTGADRARLTELCGRLRAENLLERIERWKEGT